METPLRGFECPYFPTRSFPQFSDDFPSVTFVVCVSGGHFCVAGVAEDPQRYVLSRAAPKHLEGALVILHNNRFILFVHYVVHHLLFEKFANVCVPMCLY
jgi:hypothetical protein